MRKKIDWSPLWRKEDWWAIWLAAIILLIAASGMLKAVPGIPKWSESIAVVLAPSIWGKIALLAAGLLFLTFAGIYIMERISITRYYRGFLFIFVLAILAYILGNQAFLAHYGFNSVIWALIIGLLISNLFGRPAWLEPALRAELFIKTGLVLLGAGIMFNRVMSLGLYGLGVAWLVTPVVVLVMYLLGTRLLKISSRPLVATIAATTSVCGVSAGIAAGAATKAKKEEVSFAISLSLIFTVIMMLGMPMLVRLLNLDSYVGGAWIGGTVDSTGAVVASAAVLGSTAMEIAAMVKMIQNILIGIIAFVLAVYFTYYVEGDEQGEKPSAKVIWLRLPKFIIGFLLASVIFSFVVHPLIGEEGANAILKIANGLQGWLFCLSFVCIGLQSRIVDMAKLVKSGSPIALYVLGQSFNILLTLLAAWVFFSGRFFPPLH